MHSSLAPSPSKLVPFLEYLRNVKEKPTLEELLIQMQSFEVSAHELGNCVCFQNNRYSRNIIFENEHVQLLCLCWKSGQRSPIHDHAESICGVKIISGVATETTYKLFEDGKIYPLATIDYPVGVIGSQDSDIHDISNLHPDGEDLVTLHCYAPPLKEMKTYSTKSTQAGRFRPFGSGSDK